MPFTWQAWEEKAEKYNKSSAGGQGVHFCLSGQEKHKHDE